MNVAFDDTEDFEQLIQDKDRLRLNDTDPNKKYTKAKGNASYDDFITMVKTTVAKALKKYKIQVLPGEGAATYLKPHEKLEGIYIFFNLLSRTPMDGKNAQPKPKYREEIIEKDELGNVINRGIVYGQVFDCLVQFNIAAPEYETANEVINVFEEAMFRYAKYFKYHGVGDIFFVKQYEDSKMDPYRDKMSIRSLQYNVRLEKLFLMYDETIQRIHTLG